VKQDYLINLYGINAWTDYEDFLTQIAKKTGKLLKGAEPDLKAVAKIILMDWQRGKIPFFVPPPNNNNNEEKDEEMKEESKTNIEFKVEQNFEELKETNNFDIEDKNN